jgi:hypothetical protein
LVVGDIFLSSEISTVCIEGDDAGMIAITAGVIFGSGDVEEPSVTVLIILTGSGGRGVTGEVVAIIFALVGAAGFAGSGNRGACKFVSTPETVVDSGVPGKTGGKGEVCV